MNKRINIKFYIFQLFAIFAITYLIIDRIHFYKFAPLFFILFLVVDVAICILIFLINKKNVGEKKIKLANDIFDIAYIILGILTVFLGLITPGKVDGQSMNNTLNDNQFVLTYHLNYKPKVEDIVVIDMAKVLSESNDFYIKRIKAAEGQVLSFQILGSGSSYLVSIDGVPLGNMYVGEIFKITGWAYIQLGNTFTIPKGKFLVIGDNYTNSSDSRFFGLVSDNAIMGKVVLAMFPFSIL
jgi:signal peptidase I